MPQLADIQTIHRKDQSYVGLKLVLFGFLCLQLLQCQSMIPLSFFVSLRFPSHISEQQHLPQFANCKIQKQQRLTTDSRLILLRYKYTLIKLQFQRIVMNSLLQRRNIQLQDLKSSIARLSIARKAEQNHREAELEQPLREYNTAKDLADYQPEASTEHSRPKRADSIPESAGLQIFKSIKNKQYECDDSQNAFEQQFQLLEKLGEGAHGVVKKCIHVESKRQFAVKVLRMEDEHYRSIKTNFIYIKQLKHDNIIKYKALYLNRRKRVCRLIMEHSPFPSLKAGLDQNSLRFVFYKILDALAYIHQKSICHRDIKPKNILYDSQRGIVKLIDFGESKNMKLRGRYQEMFTNTGTCYYKAPEMFLGGSYTEKVDSWAVGISLYQLITGETPFESEYHSDTINNITGKEVWFDHHSFTRFSSLVKDMIVRLLKKDPKERLTCEQAKKHLWFVPHLNDIDLMQSAGFGISPTYKSEENIGLTWLLQRRSSVNDIQQLKPAKVNKSQKETMKRWLSIIGEDESNTGEQQYNFDFLESQSEDQDNRFPSSTNLTSLESIKLEGKQSATTV